MASIDNLLLIIGMPRSGTTWLHARLRAHSRIVCALDRVKEVHYFDHLYGHAIPKIGNRPQPPERDNAARFTAFQHRIDTIDEELGTASEADRTELAAERRRLDDFVSHFGSSDQWYADLFAATPRDWCLDSTPRYYHLPEQALRHMMAIADRGRFVLLLRNPYERTISGIQHRIDRHGLDWTGSSTAAQQAMAKEIAGLANAGEQISRLLDVVPEDLVHIEFFDRIRSDPEAMVRGVLAKLGLPYEAACMAQSAKSPNPSTPQRLNADVKATIYEETRQAVANFKALGLAVPQSWDDAPDGNA